MVIASSAIAAIFFGEPERQKFLSAITSAPSRLISAATVLEAGIILESRQGEAAGREFDLFAGRANLQTVSVDAEQGDVLAQLGASTERAGTRQASTSVIALHTPWPSPSASRCSQKGPISP